jgi:hypothetical protein
MQIKHLDLKKERSRIWTRETNPWVEKVKNLLNGLGHSYIINNINSIKLNLNTIKQLCDFQY